MERIYLDYNATTPILPDVYEAMAPYLTDKWGNPSSRHWAGENLQHDIEKARANIAKSLNCSSEEIFFTSSGTESSNWAIKMSVLDNHNKKNKKHIITTKVEHPATLETCKFLEKFGVSVTYLNVDQYGNLNINELENAITKDTVLISIMIANNETGVIFPFNDISKIAEKHNILFHTDAVQAYGKTAIDLRRFKPDFLSISGHKVYSPKGIGVLYVKKGVKIHPLLHGGGQEKGLRSSTENVPGIIALGKSAEIIQHDISLNCINNIEQLRDTFEDMLFENLDNISINGNRKNRLVNTTNICFKNIETAALIKALSVEGIAVSAASACAANKGSYSHVLKAMGKSKMEALSSIRVSLGKSSNKENISIAAEKIINWVRKLRKFSPEKF